MPHLLDTADGKTLWKGPQMTGATVRGYYPVFWKDLVLWRTETCGIDAYQNDIQAATEDGKLCTETRRKHGWSREAEDVIRTLRGQYTEAKYRQEQQYVQSQMKAGKHPRSFYAVWANVNAYNAWDEVEPLSQDLQELCGPLERRGDFAPAYKDEFAGPLNHE